MTLGRWMVSVTLLLLGSLNVEGQTLRALAAGNAGTVSMSNVGFSTMRTEFRIENLSQSSTTRRVWSLGNVPWADTKCEIPANTLTLYCKFMGDAATMGGTDFDLTGRTDVRVRWQRDAGAKTGRIDIWNGDCSSHETKTRTTVPGGAPITFTGSFAVGQGVTLGFLRVYSTLDNVGACPVDAPEQAADTLDFRFEGDSLMDSSGHNYQLSISGHTMVNSHLYPPRATITGWSSYKPVFRAGTPITFDGSSSTAFSGNGVPSGYLWQQVGGPAESSFSSRTEATATITAPVAGEYTYRLEVTDASGATAAADQTVGVVATDEQGIVVTPNSELSAILGPVTRHGTSPWPWYDVGEAAVADALRAPYTTPLTEIAQEGLLNISKDPPNRMEGTSIVCGGDPCGITLTVTGASLSPDLVGKSIFVHWDADGDGTYKGRAYFEVVGVDNPTMLRVRTYYWLLPLARCTDMRFSIAGPDMAGYAAWSQSGNPWNFYEALLGVYRLHHRTGLTSYLDQARSFCELWWRYALNSGHSIGVPRNNGWQSMMACAADNHPTWWSGLAYNIEYGMMNPATPVNPPGQWSIDIREATYQTRATALMARFYPAHTANPAETRAKWCGYLKNQVTNYWIHTLTEPGYWQENMTYWHMQTPLAPINGKYGTSPWRASGLAILALEYAYESLADPALCNEPELSVSVLNTARTAGGFLWDYGRTADGGLYATVLYESKGYEADPDVMNPSEMPAGSTVQVTNGSTAMVGAGTTFLTTYAPCDGTTYIGIVAASRPWVENGVYRVVSCEDNTHLTIATPYPNTTETVTQYARSKVASTQCAPSLASHCEPDFYDNRNLAADAAAGAGWLYVKTGDPMWKDRAQFYAGKSYGGRPGGPGSLEGVPTGPNADGRTTNLADVLPSCASHPAPCGSGFIESARGKQFGMSAGTGNVPVMLAHILGGSSTEDERDVVMGFVMPTNAQAAKVTVMRPDGSNTQKTCAAPPCEVKVDARQGDHLVKTDYLANDGTVVAPGKPKVTKVR